MTTPIGAGGWLAYALMVVLKVTVVFAVAGVLSWSLRGRPAALRHAVWVAGTAAALALAFLGAFVPALRIAVPAPAWAYATSASAAASATSASSVSSATTASVATSPATERGSLNPFADAAAFPARVGSADGATGPAVDGGPVTPRVSWLRTVAPGVWLLSAWLAGVCVVLGVTLFSLLHVWVFARQARPVHDERSIAAVQRIARELGITGRVRLLEGDARAMPMTFGVLRASLLLPSSASEWSAARLDAVLRHELAHIRRRDALTQLMASLGCALYWFHPGMWLAAARLRIEREHACDDVVLAAGGRATAYAAQLLEIAKTMRALPRFAHASFAMAHRSRLRGRLEAVLADRPRATRVPRRVLLPFAVAGLVLVCTLAMVTPTLAFPTVATPRTDVPREAGTLTSVTDVAAAASQMIAGVAAQPGRAVTPPTDAPVLRMQERNCWQSSTTGGSVVATTSGDNSTSSFVMHDGERHRIVQRSLDGVSLCMRVLGDVVFDDTGAITAMPPQSLVVLAARGAGPALNLVVAPGAPAPTHTWTVNGVERPFDAEAREWRDAMLQLLHSSGESSRIRGEVASLRGQIASVHGRRASMMGEIASIRGQVASMRGEIASARGQVASLRGQIASIRGAESSMRAELHSVQGQRAEEIERRIAEYDAARRVREIEEQIRRLEAQDPVGSIEARIAQYDAEARIAEVETRLAQLDVGGEVARIEALISALDADRRVAAVEQRIPAQERRLRAALARFR